MFQPIGVFTRYFAKMITTHGQFHEIVLCSTINLNFETSGMLETRVMFSIYSKEFNSLHLHLNKFRKFSFLSKASQNEKKNSQNKYMNIKIERQKSDSQLPHTLQK